MTLSSRVDGLLIVTRLNVVRRPMLAELKRLLKASQANVLGFVVAAGDIGKKDDAYGYGYSTSFGYGGDARVEGTTEHEGGKASVGDSVEELG
jgi:Mrp family chromosome partitioning ATPase